MAEAREFPKEWIVQVNDMFTNNKSLKNADAIPRVATPLMDLKREAYIPHFLSLGPYHHWKLDTDFESSSVGDGCYQYPERKMSTAEAYKVQSAAPLWKTGDNQDKSLGDGCYQYPERKMSTAEAYKVQSAAPLWKTGDNQDKSLDDIVKNIEKMKKEIERFYDCPIISREDRYFKDFALMMTIDAYFLLSFLFRLSSDQHRDMVSLSTLDVCIKCDILKLENQIPLSVLEMVFDNQKSQADDHGFNRLLVEASKELCPFDFDFIERANSNQIKIGNERHLLGFMHKFVSPFLNMQASRTADGVDRRTLLQSTKHFLEVVIAAVLKICVKHPTYNDQRDFHNAYNAGQMVKAGIKFKSFAKPPYEIRFDTYSGTLYLPRIIVSHMQTEVFLRNMMALEFNDATGRNQVTRYVGLMDCIRDCHVIRRGSLVLTDEWIAKMWNDLRHPFFTGELEPHDSLKAALEEVLIRKYYKSRLKKVLWEVYWEHLSKPGKGIALLVGILILAMTVVQTYCSIYGLRHNH